VCSKELNVWGVQTDTKTDTNLVSGMNCV
jgi:hypothetical protein